MTPVLRVNWAKQRCWHGESVTIQVRASYVLPNALVDLAIFAQGNLVAVDTVAGQALANGELNYVYLLNWKTKVVPPNSSLFEVVATLQDPVVASARSAPLHVDLVVPVFSA